MKVASMVDWMAEWWADLLDVQMVVHSVEQMADHWV